MASFKNWSKTETTRKAGYNQFEIDQYNEATGEYTLSRVGNEQKTALNTEELPQVTVEYLFKPIWTIKKVWRT